MRYSIVVAAYAAFVSAAVIPGQAPGGDMFNKRQLDALTGLLGGAGGAGGAAGADPLAGLLGMLLGICSAWYVD